MIYACDLGAAIGNRGELPWNHIKADMQWFVQNTKGKIVLMGSNTWKSLPAKLPNRINVVVSTKPASEFAGADIVISGEAGDILNQLKSKYPDNDIVIIGGQKIYLQFYQYAELIHVSLIQGVFEGDTFFDCRGMMQKAYKLEFSSKSLGDANSNTPDVVFETYRRPVH